MYVCISTGNMILGGYHWKSNMNDAFCEGKYEPLGWIQEENNSPDSRDM